MAAIDKMEPEASEYSTNESQQRASIAISLKRIADALTKTVGGNDVYQSIAEALTGLESNTRP